MATAEPKQGKKKKRASLGAIFLTLFLDILGFSLVLPFLAAEARDVFGTPEVIATLLGSVYSLMQFLCVPVWGRLSDRIGRRPVLTWSVGASAVCMAGLGVGLAFGGSVGWLFAARVAGGIATANIGTASAYIADVTGPEDRAKGMGIIGVAFGLGFVLGPALGGVLAEIPVNGRHGPIACFVAAALSVINFAWVAIGLPESLPEERRALAPKRSLSPFDLAAARETFSDRGIALAIVVNFLALVSFTSLDQTFRFYTGDLFALSARGTGLVLTLVGFIAAGVQGGLIRLLSKRYQEPTLVRWGVAIQAVAFAGLAVAPHFGLGFMVASVCVLALGNGLCAPSLSAFVSRRAPPHAQGATLGTSQSMASLSRMIGPAAGGFLYETLGPTSPYGAACIGMLAALGCAALLPSRATSS